MKYSVIDVGTHITPPASMWEQRFPPELRHLAPKIAVRDFDGLECEVLMIEGKGMRSHAGSLGVPYEDYVEKWGFSQRLDDGREGNRDPKARLTDMDIQKVDAQVIVRNNYPNLWPDNRTTWWAMIRAFNDWLGEFCAYSPERLIGVGELPVWDMDLTLAEAEKIKDLGLRAVLMPIVPGYVGDWSAPACHDYTSPYWDPLWAKLEELDLVMVGHIDAFAATSGLEGYYARLGPTVGLMANKAVPSEMICSLIMAKVFDRFPGLRLVLNETGAGWLAHLVPWMEIIIEKQRHLFEPFGLQRRPKEYIRDHVLASFLWDSCAVPCRDIIGIESIAWCSDYPENYGTFPDSKMQQDKDLAGTTPDERYAILAGNAARVFKL